MRRFNVVIPRDDGGVESYPMKQWLRQHPDELPGYDADNYTSHQLWAAFRRRGWSVQETDTEVRLIKPGIANATDVVNAVLGGSEA